MPGPRIKSEDDPGILSVTAQKMAESKPGHDEWGGECGFLILVMPGPRIKSEDDPGIFSVQHRRMRQGYLYIMTNRPRGVLYVGVTSDLPRRVYEHREGLIDGFKSRYGLIRLVYHETFAMVADAIQREKSIKHWSRAWKISLIEAMNPEWRDLCAELV